MTKEEFYDRINPKSDNFIFKDRYSEFVDEINSFFGEDNVDITSRVPNKEILMARLDTKIELLNANTNSHAIFTDTDINVEEGIYENYQKGKFTFNTSYDRNVPILEDIIKMLLFDYSYRVIIRWKKVKVSNEKDEYTNIYNLFARINVSAEMRLANSSFELLKSTYTRSQLISGYSHSHLPGRENNTILLWGHPCLGNGPIINTLNTLASEYDADEWLLFLAELDTYVHTESLKGGPYMYLSSIGHTYHGNEYNSKYSRANLCTRIYSEIPEKILIPWMTEFFKHCIRARIFKFFVLNNQICIDMSNKECLIIGNEFVKWFNMHHKYYSSIFGSIYKFLYKKELLFEVSKEKGLLYRKGKKKLLSDSRKRLVGSYMFTFKSKEVCLEMIEDEESATVKYASVLNENVLCFIKTRLLTYLNMYYGKKDICRKSETYKEFTAI